jgi:4-hydroxyphenylpyruvate dioxygenase
MSANPLKLRQIHHVEFWVGNAKQAAFFYRQAFGFSQFAYAGLETGQRAATSYALQQGKARFLLTTPLSPEGPIADHIRVHGDGVRDIAFQVDDAAAAFEEAVRRGAKPAAEPHTVSDEHGEVRRAAIHTYGDTLHSFISTTATPGPSSRASSHGTCPGPTSASCASITSSGTSSSGRWTSGRRGTATCSGSSGTSASTTRTSPPSTARS